MMPVSSPEGYCMIEITADGNPPVQHRLSLSYRASQVSLAKRQKIAICFEHFITICTLVILKGEYAF